MLNMRVLDYRITSDANQVIVNRVRRNETGEISMIADKSGNMVESQSIVGYYGNLSKALVGIQRHYVLSDGVEINTINDYKRELETVSRAAEDVLTIGEAFS